MRAKVVLMAVALLLVSTPIPAQQRQPAVAVGAGTSTCAQFADDYRRDPQNMEFAYFSWAQGFMTGYNWVISDPIFRTGITDRDLLAMDTRTQMARIRQFCDLNPLKNYVDAVFVVFNQMPYLPPRR